MSNRDKLVERGILNSCWRILCMCLEIFHSILEVRYHVCYHCLGISSPKEGYWLHLCNEGYAQGENFRERSCWICMVREGCSDITESSLHCANAVLFSGNDRSTL